MRENMVLQANELGEVIPSLSRTISLKKNRKRKRDRGIVFEIRATTDIDKNGVGMFAVCNIACGDIIISHEEPIVATSARSNAVNKICSYCATPVGTLRKDHIKNYNDTEVPLNDVFHGKSGPLFFVLTP